MPSEAFLQRTRGIERGTCCEVTENDRSPEAFSFGPEKNHGTKKSGGNLLILPAYVRKHPKKT
jgi:hypothetical protein